jgi:spore germination cell wall hydrolase CwlJ-like protein
MALQQDDTTEPRTFTWGANGARMTPEDIAAQNKVAQAMAAQAGDASPFPTGTRGFGEVTQGLARVAKGISAGMDYREADAASKANADDNKAMIATLLGGGAPAPAAAPSVPAAAVAVPVASAAPVIPSASTTPDRIYNEQDKDNPFEPSAADRDAAIRTVYGEAANEPTKGQLAVASVIRNRAFDGGYGGNTASGVVHAPNQFEPWNGGVAKDRMLALSPSDPKYQAIGKVVDAAYGFGPNGAVADDPTEGKTMFYSPGAQAALGRAPPPWAKGEGQVIGGHGAAFPD